MESRYRGPEVIYYKKADLSELKYIKVTYTDLSNETHEIKTEVNFLCDDHISLYVKRKKYEKKEEEEEITNAEELEDDEPKDYCNDYLKTIAEIKELKDKADRTGNYEEYRKRLEELQLQHQDKKPKTPVNAEEDSEDIEQIEEDAEEEAKKYEVDCPQKVSLKFVIGDLLYIANGELREVQVKPTKVYFRIVAPETLKLQQKRKFYRINLKRLCLLVAEDKDGRGSAFVARSINLSAGGVLVNKLESMTDTKYVRINPDEYETYHLVIVLEMDKILKLSARFIREEQGRKSYRYAFEFVNIGEKKINFISKYVIGKQIEELRADYDAKNRPIIERKRR